LFFYSDKEKKSPEEIKFNGFEAKWVTKFSLSRHFNVSHIDKT